MFKKIIVFSLGCIVSFIVLKQVIIHHDKRASLRKAVMELNYFDGFYNISVEIQEGKPNCFVSKSDYKITLEENILEYDKDKIKEIIIKEFQRCKHEQEK